MLAPISLTTKGLTRSKRNPSIIKLHYKFAELEVNTEAKDVDDIILFLPTLFVYFLVRNLIIAI
jgi:hypothetical protein